MNRSYSKIRHIQEANQKLERRLMNEQELDRELPRQVKGILGHNDNWYDEGDRPVNPDDFEYDEEIEFGPDDFENYISQTEKDFPDNRWSFGLKGLGGAREPGRGYFDRYTKMAPIKLRKKRY